MTGKKQDTVNIRRTDWDCLLTSRPAGYREGRYHFVYDADGPSLFDYFGSAEGFRDMEDEERADLAEEYIADSLELEAILMRGDEGLADDSPFVRLAPADFDRLCELTRLADSNIRGNSNLIRFLIHEDASSNVTMTYRDYNDLSDLAQLLIRDMPDDEPKRLDYRCIIERVMEMNPDE